MSTRPTVILDTCVLRDHCWRLLADRHPHLRGHPVPGVLEAFERRLRSGRERRLVTTSVLVELFAHLMSAEQRSDAFNTVLKRRFLEVWRTRVLAYGVEEVEAPCPSLSADAAFDELVAEVGITDAGLIRLATKGIQSGCPTRIVSDDRELSGVATRHDVRVLTTGEWVQGIE